MGAVSYSIKSRVVTGEFVPDAGVHEEYASLLDAIEEAFLRCDEDGNERVVVDMSTQAVKSVIPGFWHSRR